MAMQKDHPQKQTNLDLIPALNLAVAGITDVSEFVRVIMFHLPGVVIHELATAEFTALIEGSL